MTASAWKWVNRYIRGYSALWAMRLKVAPHWRRPSPCHQRYQPVVMGQGKVWLEDKGDYVTLHWQPASRTPALLKPLNESIMVSYLYFGRQVTGLTIYPTAVSFCHSKPARQKDYQSLFRCTLIFDAQSNSMTVPKQILTTPLKEADPQLNALMLHELQAGSAKEGDMTTAQLVEQWIARQLGQGPINIALIANYLHMSERTLRRRLEREQQSVLGLKEQVRRERAEYWLCHTNKPIGEISKLLGYRSNSCFSQAFKGWHGMSARNYRSMNSEVQDTRL